MRIEFWVYEGKNFSWLFEDEINNTEDIDRVARRVDLVSRTARLFFRESPLSPEEREVYLKLVRAVWSEKAKTLLYDLL
jgi:hypothetical protein